ncbi:hypothetical protein HDU76_002195 [Blyttiomyces sp. JEL0837]|nr:hypothetical protein HDU76_002195 [Blyttiomyces sp. JEL0837]
MEDPVVVPPADPSVPAQSGGVNASPNVKIVEEFQYLLEKSQQLFAGLRDLPPTGRNWQPYFQRTFEVYTKLWKFQQQHRPILENKDLYGLKRWEIGEIASKIGQLYYHYYLRTSETNYLYESYVFYEAIRDRQYFRDVMETKSPALMIKKLRYFARFIVVCLLLNRNDVIKKLMEELTMLVDEYTKAFKPSDSAEWNVVLSEISTFLEAEKKLTPVDVDGNAIQIPNRIQIEKTPRLDKDGQPKLKLQEAILVGNYQNQIKFSELTLDMYRVLQTLEREPMTTGGKVGGAMENPVEKRDEGSDAIDGADKSAFRRSNPHKYLLYRPTLAQLLLYISTAFKDINESSCLLLYLSADGAKRQSKPEGADGSQGYQGGIATAVNYSRKASEKSDADQAALLHCLHPNDLVPFTRKPMFLIVDSTNSIAFKVVKQLALSSFRDLFLQRFHSTQIGSLFTLFLHSPLKAFALISDLAEMPSETWEKCQALLIAAEKDIAEQLEGPLSATLDKSIKKFMQDDFLRQMIIRFVLCSVILHMHANFREPKHQPSSYPPVPPGLLTATEVTSKIQDLATASNCAQLFPREGEGN